MTDSDMPALRSAAAVRRLLSQPAHYDDEIRIAGRHAELEALHAALRQEERPTVRAAICRSLRFRTSPESIQPLTTVLADADQYVASCAAEALRDIEGRGIAPPLLEALKRERRPDVRSSLVFALRGSSDESVVEPLAALLRDQTEDPRVRFLAAESLEVLATPQAAEFLSDAAARFDDPALSRRASRLDAILAAARWGAFSELVDVPVDKDVDLRCGKPPSVRMSAPLEGHEGSWFCQCRIGAKFDPARRWPFSSLPWFVWADSARDVRDLVASRTEMAFVSWVGFWCSSS